MKRSLHAVIFFGALLFLWHQLVASNVWNPLVLPDPMDVARYIKEALADYTIFQALGVTMKRLLLGYAVGVVLGIPLGLVTARLRWAHDTIGVLALGLQTLPSVCWVPLALLWFGQSEWAMLYVVLMGTVWSVVISTDNGVRAVPPIYSRAALTMGSSGLHMWVKVILPAALPFIVSGVKQGWAFAWRSLMAAEIYVTIRGYAGLGQLLQYGRDNQEMAQVVGIMLVIIVIGLLADKILFAPWERFMHSRWGLAKA